MKRACVGLCVVWLATLSAAMTPARAADQTPLPDPPAQAARYTILVGGNKGGQLAMWTDRDGTQRSVFEYHDRGRGPHLSTTRAVDGSGLPIALDVVGHNYRRIPVAERFRLDGARAQWQSAAEQGETAVTAPAFYLSFEGSPDELEPFAAALLRAPNHGLPVLPRGAAQIRRVTERTVAAQGRSATVVLYEISGLEFAPVSLWLTDDRRLFAAPAGWFAVAIREGWESAWPTLLEAQQASAAERGASLAQAHVRKPTAPLVFRGVNLFDSARARSLSGMTVVISGDRIEAVGADGQVPVPAGATVIDGKGKSLLPGLWDMHVHLTGEDGLLHLAAGITTVRDVGNTTEELEVTRRKYDEGTLIGPRVVPAGFIDGRGPYQGPTTVFADSAEEARAHVAHYHSLGYPQIKVYNSVKPEVVRVIAQEAHRRGLRLSGHVPTAMSAQEFILAGADELQHVDLLFFSLLDMRITDPSGRAKAVAQRAAGFDLESARAKQLIAFLQKHQTVLDPTVNVFETLMTARVGEVTPTFAVIADRVPAQVRRRMLKGGLPVPASMDQTYRESHRKLLQFVAVLHRSGIRIVAGSDDLAGFTLHRELELYGQAGIPPHEVLQLATLGAARIMRLDHELGSIAVGKKADVILVAGDPAKQISDIRKVEMTVKGGVPYDPAQLYRAIGVRPN